MINGLDNTLNKCSPQIVGVYHRRSNGSSAWFTWGYTFKEYAELLKRRADTTRVLHTINVKGVYNKDFFDSVLKKKFTDTTYGIGRIFFAGTYLEYEEYLDFLIENEGKLNLKII